MPEAVTNSIGHTQLRALEQFGRRISVDSKILLLRCGGEFQSHSGQLAEIARRVLNEYTGLPPQDPSQMPVWQFGDENLVLAAVLKSTYTAAAHPEPAGLVMLDLGPHAGDGDRPDPPSAAAPYWTEMLRLLVENYRAATKADEQIEKVGTELAQTYEELVLLHKLSTNMRLTEQDATFLQMACESITEMIPVEGIAVLLEKTVDGEQRWVVAAGSGLIDLDEQMAAALHSRLVEQISAAEEALLDSEVDSPFKYDWPPSIRNIIAVPLRGKNTAEMHHADKTHDPASIIGVMVAVNRIGKPDFDSIDANLFNSVANSCAVFIENDRLFTDLKELFIGSLRALTNSIDAKDQYTRGHSERVAIISRWIAEKYSEQIEPLDAEYIHRIYLAGLLHDIGKIGIDESVLRKAGKLTDREYDAIKKHPSIGAGILREIRQMRDIVPGVLCHHERVDGKGYPNGLTGDRIPLIGKIVGLADCFDAITSKRTYRDAKTVEDALAEVEKGLGTQFDRTVGKLFIENDVYRLWDILQGDPAAGVHGERAFAEYGTAAVGTLIR